MNINFANWRLPFREDKLFSVIFFICLVIPAAFTLYTFENFETIKYGLWLILTGFALAAFGFQKLLSTENAAGLENQKFPRGKKFFLVILAFFWITALVSVFFAPDRLHALVGFYYRFVNGFLFYTIWAVFVALLCVGINRQRLLVLCKALVAVTIVISVLGIIQSMGIAFYTGLEPSGFLRAPSLLGNPNFSTMFIVSVLPLALAFFLATGRFAAKIYYGTGSFFMLWSLVLLSSRGAWLALIISFFAAVVLLLVYKFRLKLLLYILGTTLLFIFMGGIFLGVTRPTSLTATLGFTDNNINSRLYAWDIARQAITKHPLTGVGLGNFQIFYERTHGKHLPSGSAIFDDPHNVFLQLGATGGLPLLGSFLLLLLLPVILALRSLRKEKDFLPIALLCGLVAWAVAASFTPVSIPNFLVLAVLLTGLLPAEGSLKTAFRFKLKFPLLVLGIILVVLGIIFLIGEYTAYSGRQAYFYGDYTKAFRLENLALKFNPTNGLFYIYRAGSSIKSHKPSAESEQHILAILKVHSKESRQYVSVSNLYYLLYQESGDSKDLRAAEDYMLKALQFDPLYAERYGKLALYYYVGGQNEKAIQALEAVLSLDQKQFPSWILLAKIYQDENRREPALYALEKAFKLQPDLPQMRLVWHWAKLFPDIRQVPLIVTLRQESLE